MYVIDSDVFISAKNAYYAFDICPGFWDSVIDHYQAGRVCSIDHIRQELLAGNEKEDLVQWVKSTVPPDFFASSQEADVIASYGQIMLWVQRSIQYTDAAKAKFATEADGWLVAHGMVHGIEVVTNEQPRPEARSRILLPDVCDQFGVQYHNTFEMLSALGARYYYQR
ncbi:MAG: DUF4411 family protein [Candidatus Thiodiazotropha lotti]|uniref:DUF4411 family protein n=1 Tax=Candidatus Thiodiazotropha lotti TaxID=2792787 RepID=A0A9E4K6A3_9GAMM|nr:DUF4411 family protein [Candidatus Thiodiazotropha lotti]MCG7939611.1 DUF4411 family protein [Candidatus Thiodiazotropha lotti]MCW4204084.1 DUF4411 family protein [Candidatus Thiodiazotropha lotti]MCW4222466.1 DUF4411 family protein [Candidatus Thiodiazotropha lotti]